MKKILLVDDDEDVLAALRRLLDRPARGWSCQTAIDGCEALVKLQAEGADLLITDLKMPEMNGFELLDVVNESHPGLPTLILSSLTGVTEMARFQDQENLRVLEKPVKATILEDLVARALELPIVQPESRHLPSMLQEATETSASALVEPADTAEFLDGEPVTPASAPPQAEVELSTQGIPITPDMPLPETGSGALVLAVATRSTGAVLTHLVPPRLDESLEHKLSDGKQSLFLEPEVMERLDVDGLEELAFVCHQHCEVLRPLKDYPDLFLYGIFRRQDFNIAMASLTLRSLEANAHKLPDLQALSEDDGS